MRLSKQDLGLIEGGGLSMMACATYDDCTTSTPQQLMCYECQGPEGPDGLPTP